MTQRIAFHAPMKPPDHPTPSGDRRMARLFLDALRHAGYAPEIASDLRVRDGAGDPAVQARYFDAAKDEIDAIAARWSDDPPALWFTYHCYYKAPDLIGPALTERFGIPYVIAEASRARKRLEGPWATFAQCAEAAIDRADLLLAMTEHDRFALDRDAKAGQEVVDFPPFIDPGDTPPRKASSDALHLLTVAMMRGEDKLASYRAMAEAVHGLGDDWHLTIIGDGPHRTEVQAMFEGFGNKISFAGEISDTPLLRQHYEAADVFVWPGVNEAYGMVYLEAQAAGTPVVAEDWPGPQAVIGTGSKLTAKGDPKGLCNAIKAVGSDPDASASARLYILDRHSMTAAAENLAALLRALS